MSSCVTQLAWTISPSSDECLALCTISAYHIGGHTFPESLFILRAIRCLSIHPLAGFPSASTRRHGIVVCILLKHWCLFKVRCWRVGRGFPEKASGPIGQRVMVRHQGINAFAQRSSMVMIMIRKVRSEERLVRHSCIYIHVSIVRVQFVPSMKNCS